MAFNFETKNSNINQKNPKHIILLTNANNFTICLFSPSLNKPRITMKSPSFKNLPDMTFRRNQIISENFQSNDFRPSSAEGNIFGYASEKITYIMNYIPYQDSKKQLVAKNLTVMNIGIKKQEPVRKILDFLFQRLEEGQNINQNKRNEMQKKKSKHNPLKKKKTNNPVAVHTNKNHSRALEEKNTISKSTNVVANGNTTDNHAITNSVLNTVNSSEKVKTFTQTSRFINSLIKKKKFNPINEDKRANIKKICKMMMNPYTKLAKHPNLHSTSDLNYDLEMVHPENFLQNSKYTALYKIAVDYINGHQERIAQKEVVKKLQAIYNTNKSNGKPKQKKGNPFLKILQKVNNQPVLTEESDKPQAEVPVNLGEEVDSLKEEEGEKNVIEKQQILTEKLKVLKAKRLHKILKVSAKFCKQNPYTKRQKPPSLQSESDLSDASKSQRSFRSINSKSSIDEEARAIRQIASPSSKKIIDKRINKQADKASKELDLILDIKPGGKKINIENMTPKVVNSIIRQENKKLLNIKNHALAKQFEIRKQDEFNKAKPKNQGSKFVAIIQNVRNFGYRSSERMVKRLTIQKVTERESNLSFQSYSRSVHKSSIDMKIDDERVHGPDNVSFGKHLPQAQLPSVNIIKPTSLEEGFEFPSTEKKVSPEKKNTNELTNTAENILVLQKNLIFF